MSNYPIIGQCIYCGAHPTEQDPLSDEHIFPFGIFGKQKLRKASCKECAKVTSAVERKVQQDDLGGLRIILDFPTRDKGRRPKLLPMIVERGDGTSETIKVPPEDYLAVLALPLFNPPAHLENRDYENGIKLIGYASIVPQQQLRQIAQKYNAIKVTGRILRWPDAWARMFAKIAYAYTVKHLGLSAVANAYVIDAILGKSNDIGKWVGCDSQDVFGTKGNEDSHIVSHWIIDSEIHVRIKLFAWMDVPEYIVVVGRAAI